MTDLEDRLRRGHPEERDHRPPPFDAVRARPLAPAPAARRWLRLVPLAAAGIAAVAVVALARPWSPAGGGAGAGVGPPAGLGAGDPAASATAQVRPGGGAAPTSPGLGSGAVACGPAEPAECDRIVGAVRQSEARTIVAIAVTEYVPACIRAGLCASPVAHDPWLVHVTAASGERFGLVCDAADCARAAAADLADFAVLRVSVDSPDDETLLLRDEAGTSWTFAGASTLEQPLPVGRWVLTTTGDRPCSVELDAATREVVDVRLSLRDPAPCRVEVR